MADQTAVGDLHLATVVINAQDMQRAVEFWCAAWVTDAGRSTGTRSS